MNSSQLEPAAEGRCAQFQDSLGQPHHIEVVRLAGEQVFYIRNRTAGMYYRRGGERLCYGSLEAAITDGTAFLHHWGFTRFSKWTDSEDCFYGVQSLPESALQVPTASAL